MFRDFQDFFWLVFGQEVMITWMAIVVVWVGVALVASIDLGLAQILKKGGDNRT